MSEMLLEARNLSVVFGKGKNEVNALQNISFVLKRGEVLGIVGESGSGKSTLARAVIGLQKVDEGNLYWQGQSLLEFNSDAWNRYHRRVQMIFQDPLDALNPTMTVRSIIEEPLLNFFPKDSAVQRYEKIDKVLESVGLPSTQVSRYPHEFSGGQCQRIGIARALAVQPDLLVCDEPVSALDVSVQARVVNLLAELKQQLELSMLFISHDLNIVRHICDRVLVLYEGKIVEMAETNKLFAEPKHLYTRQLLNAIPRMNPEEEQRRIREWRRRER